MNNLVYNSGDAIDFLANTYEQMQRRNPKYSLRGLAKALGMSNVGLLSMILKRQRPMPADLVENLEQLLGLNPAEKKYLRLMIYRDRAKSEDEKAFFADAMQQLRACIEYARLDHEIFKSIDSWYHITIMEMTYLKDFKPSPEWIAARLGYKVTPQNVSKAILTLLDLGLLFWNEQGTLTKCEHRLASLAENNSLTLRGIHKQYLQQAFSSIDQQGKLQRDISTHVVSTSLKKIGRAKEMIREFRLQLGDFLQEQDGDAVYVFSVQLFNALQPESENDAI